MAQRSSKIDIRPDHRGPTVTVCAADQCHRRVYPPPRPPSLLVSRIVLTLSYRRAMMSCGALARLDHKCGLLLE